MRNLLLSLCLLFSLYSHQATAIDVNPYLSGSWFNPAQNGHGFSVEIISDTQAVFYWYVYNPDGSPTFLITVATIAGDTLKGTTYYNSGMVWGVFNPATLTEVVWGSIDIKFIDCSHATMSYKSTHDIEGIPSGMGTINLQRLLTIEQMQCNDNVYAGIYEGNFTSNETLEVTTGTILLSTSGDVVAFSFNDSLSFGTYFISGGKNLFSGGVTHSANSEEDFVDSYEASGPIAPDYRLIFNWDIDNQDRGVGNTLSVSSLYRRGVTLNGIAGEWTTQDLIGNGVWTTVITENGTIEAMEESGCEAVGKITIPDMAFNLFDVTLELTECGDDNGEYEGMGYQLDAFALGDRRLVRIFVGNLENAIAVQLSR